MVGLSVRDRRVIDSFEVQNLFGRRRGRSDRSDRLIGVRLGCIDRKLIAAELCHCLFCITCGSVGAVDGPCAPKLHLTFSGRPFFVFFSHESVVNSGPAVTWS